VGCLALVLNVLIPGLGTVSFTNRRIQGFIQLALSIVNLILIVVSLGIWAFIGTFIHLILFVWSLAATISYISEASAKKVIQQERSRYESEQ
jgi:uncharacterized membrane protein